MKNTNIFTILIEKELYLNDHLIILSDYKYSKRTYTLYVDMIQGNHQIEIIKEKVRDLPADLFVVIVDDGGGCVGGATAVGTVFSLSEIQP